MVRYARNNECITVITNNSNRNKPYIYDNTGLFLPVRESTKESGCVRKSK